MRLRAWNSRFALLCRDGTGWVVVPMYSHCRSGQAGVPAGWAAGLRVMMPAG